MEHGSGQAGVRFACPAVLIKPAKALLFSSRPFRQQAVISTDKHSLFLHELGHIYTRLYVVCLPCMLSVQLATQGACNMRAGMSSLLTVGMPGCAGRCPLF